MGVLLDMKKYSPVDHKAVFSLIVRLIPNNRSDYFNSTGMGVSTLRQALTSAIKLAVVMLS